MLCARIAAIVCLCAGSMHANITPVTRGNVQAGTVLPTNATEVRVLKERLAVEIKPLERWLVTPIVTVTAEYELRHDGAEQTVLDIAFPLSGRFEQQFGMRRREPVESLGYAVTLDGQSVEATAEDLPLPHALRSDAPSLWPRHRTDPSENERLTAVMKRWVAADPHLTELLEEYARRAPSPHESARVREALDEEVRSLLKRPELAYRVIGYLRNRDDWLAIADLITEADPTFRGDARLNTFKAPDRATMDVYRERIDKWLATRPAIAELRGELERQSKLFTDARSIITERVAAHLRGKGELSDLAIARLLSYFEYGFTRYPHWGPADKTPLETSALPSQPPDIWLVGQIDPEIERERLRRIAEADEILNRYGFDATYLSPLTGRGYWRRVGWRDDSTWEVLRVAALPLRDEARGTIRDDEYAQRVTSPSSEAKLIHFKVPMQQGQTRALRVSYSALAEIDELAYGGSAWQQIVHVRYILKTARYWKSFGPIELTITMPKSGVAVIEPIPEGHRLLDGGRVEYSATVRRIDRNLRIAWLPAGAHGRSKLFDLVKQVDIEDLRELEAGVEHPQAGHILRILCALAELPPPEPLGAPRCVLRGPFRLMQAGLHPEDAIEIGSGPAGEQVREAQLRYKHVEELSRIGWTEEIRYATVRRLKPLPWDPIFCWSEEDRRIAAALALQQQEHAPTAVARLSREFLALLGTAQPDREQSAEFLRLARQDEESTKLALWLIAQFRGDPRVFAPLVMEILAKPRTETTESLHRAAQRAYAHGAAAPLEDALRLLDEFDPYEVGGAARIGELYVDEIDFESVHAICDRLVRADANVYGWIRVLHRVDRPRAIEAIDAWLSAFPDRSVLRTLGAEFQSAETTPRD